MFERPYGFACRIIAYTLVSFSTSGALFAQTLPSGVTEVPGDFSVLGEGESLGSDSTLNVFDGGSVGKGLSLGLPNGSSSDVELNVFGGAVGGRLSAFRGSTVRVAGGTIGIEGDPSFPLPQDPAITLHAGAVLSVESGSVGSKFDLLDFFAEPSFSANPGSRVTISGGRVGNNAEARGAIVTISGGEVGNSLLVTEGTTVELQAGRLGAFLDAGWGTTINVSGGVLDFGAFIRAGATVNVSGGEVGNGIGFRDGSVGSVSGGQIGAGFLAESGSDVLIAGGAYGPGFRAMDGSSVRFVGSSFFLDGVPLPLEAGVPLVIPERDVSFTGILSDGSSIDFELNTVQIDDAIDGDDLFERGATIIVELAIPEPAGTALVISSASLMIVIGRRAKVTWGASA